MKKILSLIFVMFFAFVLVGCGGGKDTGLKGISISGTGNLTVGQEVTYKAVFNPSDYKDQSVTWSTSDEAALAVDQNGKATAKAASSQVYLYAQSKAEASIKGQKKLAIKEKSGEGSGSEYPDLQGYNIRIAQAETNLSDFDPFLEGYQGSDKEAKQEAWRSVEKDFNCTIEVAAYPSSAEWGPSRWNYILNQAALGVSDYDFLTVPDQYIATFVEGQALISMEEFYILHGDNMMDPSFQTSGSYQGQLYSFTTAKNDIYAVMYYNIGLYEKLKEADSTLEEPAQIFLDGNWTHSEFEKYCEKVQQVMAKAFGEAGTAGSTNQEYWAVSGWATYWWAGLASNDGEALADVTSMTINVDTPHKQKAAEIVKNLYSKKIAATPQSVDQNVTQWNEGKALFNTGDLWFVKADNRWSKTLWQDDTRYGYVPWPRADEIEFEDLQVALGNTATWVMPIGRDYLPYGEECNAENIYWAIAELYKRADKLHKESAGYDAVTELNNKAAKFADSEASQEAFIYMQQLIQAGKAYFDPLITSGNPVGSLYNGVLNKAVNAYCVSGSVGTWEEAITSAIPTLQEALRKAFS